MLYTDEEFTNADNTHSEQAQNKPNAYRVDDDDNLDQEDLKRNMFLGDADTNPVMEGQPMGGETFGQNNVTPSGEDRNNLSENAGYSNAYFRRREPAEEHPENNNFKAEEQGGAPNYNKAVLGAPTETEANKGGNSQQDTQQTQEGTADNDGHGDQTNIPGPNELPDQQKVGESTGDDNTGDKFHVET